MAKQPNSSLRQHLDNLLRMKGAHLTFHAAVTDFPVALRGAKPPGVPHSAWQLIEHMRIAQQDILDFSRQDTKRRSSQTTTGLLGRRLRAKRPGTRACNCFNPT